MPVAPPAAAARLLALLALLALTPALSPAAAPAAAQEAQQHRRHGIDCRCRANGRTYGMGERACVNTPAGFRLAECGMAQNVTSWSVVPGEGGCVVSALPPPPPAAAAAAGGG